jgi:hypothetical protein
MPEMRHRERLVKATQCVGFQSDCITDWHCPEQGPSYDYTYDQIEFDDFYHFEEMDDVVTPLYKRLSGQGHIINSPMTKISTITRDNPCTLYSSWGKGLWNTECAPDAFKDYLSTVTRHDWPSSTMLGGWAALPEIPDYDVTNKIALAVTNAWARVDVTDMQLLVSMGEGKKTVLSLISMAKRMIKVMKSIKKLDSRSLLFELSPKQLADRYMELRYALRPLVYEAKGIAAAIASGNMSKTDRVTFRGSTMYEDDGVSTDAPTQEFVDACGVWTRINKPITKTWKHSIKVRSGVLTQLNALNTLNVWGLTQPVEAIWELVPFSFIIDWFINVGDTLASFTPNYGLKALASWYTVVDTKYQLVERSSAYDIYLPSTSTNEARAWNADVGNCWCDKTVVTKTRVPNPSRSILPNFTVSLDCLKLTDLVVIAKGLITKR